MITISRRLLWLDLETTGLNVHTDRIVSLAFREYLPEAPTPRTYAQIIDPGVPIPPEATIIHGLRDDDMVGKPRFSQLAPHLLKGFQQADFAGFNVAAYDLPMLAAEFERAGYPWTYTDAKIIDVLRLWKVLERRSLVRAVERFLGRHHAGAHDAQADIDTTIDVFEAMLTQFPGKIPPTIEAIHDLQWPRNPDAIDPEGKIVWRDGAAVMNFGKKWTGMRLDLMRRRDLAWIVNDATGISPEVKRICQDALDGTFPKK
jgi:DNA polymerase-3 subunit epsilon